MDSTAGPLAGRTALVTGAAGAIGSATARALIAAGAKVVLTDQAKGALTALGEELCQWSRTIRLDLGQPASIAASLAELGHVDILVNNAGVLTNAKSGQTTLEEWRRVQAVNVEAALLLIQGVLPGMRAARWGRIVNMSSYAAKSGGLTAGTAYSVSKSALIGLTFSIAREAAGDGVTVNAIAPAYVMSPMVSEQLTDDQRAAQLAQIPVGRFCSPEEVAHAVLFLASPLAGFITGEVLDMNGGLHFD